MSISVFTQPGKAFGSFPKYQITAGLNNDPDEYWIYLTFTTPGAVDYVVGPDDGLEFGIYCHPQQGGGVAMSGIEPPGSSEVTRDNPDPFSLYFGIDIAFTNNIRTSQFGLVDQNGIDVARGNKYPRASSRWYKVKASLAFFAGMEIDRVMVVNENDFGGTTVPTPDVIYTRYVVDFQNIIIRNRATGKIQKVLYQAGDPETTQDDFVFPTAPPIQRTLIGGFPFPTNFFEPIETPHLTTGGLTLGSVIRATNYDVTYNDAFVDGNGNGITFSLPSAVDHPGQIFYFRNIHATGNLTLDGDGGETIDGSATLVLTPGQKASIRSDNVNWRTF